MGTAKALRQANGGRHRAASTRSGQNCAAYVGRVGALAVALGIGAAITCGPGVAWADDPSDKPPANDDNSAPQDSGDTPGAASATDKPDLREVIRHNLQDTADNLRKAATRIEHSSGGAFTLRHRTGTASPSGTDGDDQPLRQQRSAPNRQQPTPAGAAPEQAPVQQFTQAPSRVLTRIHEAADDTTAVVRATTQHVTAALTPTNHAQDRGTAATRFSLDTDDTTTPSITAAPEPGPVIRVVSGLLAAIGFNPAATNTPVAPVSGPTLLGALGLIRRELEHLFVNKTPDVSSTPTSLTVDQDEDTTFTVPAYDADGDRLAYTVTDAPEHGDLELVGSAGTTYTYRYSADPDAPTEDAADIDDTFTITASDAAAGFHLHGLASLFNPQGAHTDTVTVNVNIEDANDAPVILSVTPVGSVNTTTGAVTYLVKANDDTTSPQDLIVTISDPIEDNGVDSGARVSTPVYDSTLQGWRFTYTPDPRDRVHAYTTQNVVEQDHFTVSVSETAAGVQTDRQTVNVAVDPAAYVATGTATAPGAGYSSTVSGADGTAAFITVTGDGTEEHPYQTTVTATHPDGLVQSATAAGYPDGDYYYRTVADDGTVTVLTRAGNGSDEHPYESTLTVLRADGSQDSATLPGYGYGYGGAALGADGAVFFESYTGDGSDEHPYETTVVLLRPDDGVDSRFTLPGLPNGYSIGTDGTVAATVATYQEAGTGWQTTTVIVRPDGSRTDLAIPGSPGSTKVGSNGTVAQTTYGPDGPTVTVLRPDGSRDTASHADGNGYAEVGADGTVTLTSQTGDGTAGDPYETTVTVLRPNGEHDTDTLSGHAHIPLILDDGTVVQSASTYTTTEAGETNVSVLRPNGSIDRATFTGRPAGLQVLDDGSIAVATVTGYGTTADQYQSILTIWHPADDTTDYRTADGVPLGMHVGADGTVAMTVASSSTQSGPYENTVIVLRADGSDHSVTGPSGYPGDAQVGEDGTVAQTTYTSSPTPAGSYSYETTVTVVHPDGSVDTKVITGRPVNAAQVLADGTVVQATSTGSGPASDYETTVTALHPDGSVDTHTIRGYPFDLPLVAADGTVVVVTDNGQGTNASVLYPDGGRLDVPVEGQPVRLGSLQNGTVALVTQTGQGTASDPYVLHSYIIAAGGPSPIDM